MTGRAILTGDRLQPCRAGELRAGDLIHQDGGRVLAVVGVEVVPGGVLTVELLGRGRVIFEAGALVWRLVGAS